MFDEQGKIIGLKGNIEEKVKADQRREQRAGQPVQSTHILPFSLWWNWSEL